MYFLLYVCVVRNSSVVVVHTSLITNSAVVLFTLHDKWQKLQSVYLLFTSARLVSLPLSLLLPLFAGADDEAKSWARWKTFTAINLSSFTEFIFAFWLVYSTSLVLMLQRILSLFLFVFFTWWNRVHIFYIYCITWRKYAENMFKLCSLRERLTSFVR